MFSPLVFYSAKGIISCLF